MFWPLLGHYQGASSDHKRMCVMIQYCMCVCVCVCVYTYVCICIYIYICVCVCMYIYFSTNHSVYCCRSQWPRGLIRGSAAAPLLKLWVRIPPGVWKFVCCECCVLSDTDLCDGLITPPEESYRLWCFFILVWYRNLVNEEALAHWGGGAVAPKTNN